MNQTHNKEWPGENAAHATPAMYHFPVTPLDHPPYGQSAVAPSSPLGVAEGASGHPPHPSGHFMPTSKSDADPRLPGMMDLAQPGTPRPTAFPRPDLSKKPYGAPAFHASPYSHHPSMIRKRSRNDSVFSGEPGPFFLGTESCDNLYALDRTTLLTVRIHSKFDRGFFLADNEWTCYRRNYFQVSSVFSIPGLPQYYADHEAQCFVSDQGQMYPVERFYLGISARVASSDKEIQLIQHTPKRDKGPQTTPQPKPIVPGGSLAMSSVSTSQSVVTFERIQFKSATANNGKRRAAQQYFVCVLDLYAQTNQGQRIKVASCQSAQLVVRGRSPGHYSDHQERHDTGIHPASVEHHPIQHDERYASGPPPFSRPPLGSPGVLPGSEYPPYSYYSSYPGYPQLPLPAQAHPHQHPPPPPQPSSNPSGHNYLVPSMSDPSSSESSSPDMYTGDINNSNVPAQLQPPHPHPHPPHAGPDGMKLQGVNIHMDHAANEWSRPRFQSTSSHDTPVYYPPASTGTPMSATPPAHFPPSPYDPRQYSSVPNLVNQ